MTRKRVSAVSSLDPLLVREALWRAVKKLNPYEQKDNLVMLLVEIGSIITTFILYSVTSRFWE
jgi:High-affinity K+ transport system, ATPase chain B